MVDKSIGYKLSFYISAAVIIVFVAFIIANFLFNQRLLRENIENRAVGLSIDVNSTINQEILSTIGITANTSRKVTYYYRNGDLDTLLRQLVSTYSYLISAEVYFDTTFARSDSYHAVVQNGSSFDYRQNNLPVFSDETEKSSYLQIKKSAVPGWSDPYIWQETGDIVASYYYPITEEQDDGSVVAGYLSSRLSLSDLNNALNQINIGPSGYAFVIDTSGNYLTHPDESKILTANIFTVPSKVFNRDNLNLRETFSQKQTISTIAYPVVFDYEKSWVYFSPINKTNWYLVFVMPYSELYKDLYDITLRIAIFALLGVVLIYFLITYITKKQIEPLSNVTSRLTSFSSPFQLNTKNEVKQVANSLEYLKIWFEQYQISREKEELNNTQHNRDLLQASEIQQSLIKNSFPAFPERSDIDIHAVYNPAQVVSGDLFDFYFIDDNNLLFTIGDVSGKGIPAAIFMSVCQTVIRNYSIQKQPRKIVEKANYELATSNNHQFFLTLFLGILNVDTGELSYCNAAHTFPLILKPDGSVIELQSTHGLPLGLYRDKKYHDEQTKLEDGDTILLYTDGVFDALNEKNILSGSKWFQRKLGKMKNLSPKEITNLLEQEIKKTENQHKDDVCLLAIKYTP